MPLLRLVLALAVLLGLCGTAEAQSTCDRIAVFAHINATGPVEIIPAVAGQRIYYCGFTITQKGNTLDLLITVGRGTNCDTDTIAFTPRMEFPNDFALSSRTEAVGPHTEIGYAMCIQTLGSNAKLGGMIFFAQF